MRAAPILPLMLAGLVLLSLALLTQVGLPLSSPSPASAEQDACPPNPSPPNPADPSIIVNTPVAGQRVTTPVLISGRARVFEAVVSITIAQGGKPIVETTTMAAEGQVFSPFSTRVPFALAGGVTEDAGCIRVFEASAKDGSPINVVQIPVTLATGPRPPSTGDGGLADKFSNSRNELLLGLTGGVLVAVLLGGVLLVRRRT